MSRAIHFQAVADHTTAARRLQMETRVALAASTQCSHSPIAREANAAQVAPCCILFNLLVCLLFSVLQACGEGA